MMSKQYLPSDEREHHLWQPDLGGWGIRCWPQRAALIIPCLSTRWLGCHWLWRRVVCLTNYIDRDIDRKMERTKNRVLVKGLISPAVSLVYATLLGIAGFMLLWFGANPLACWLGVMGFVVYVGVYSLYMKRHFCLRHIDWFALRRCAAGDRLLCGNR